MYYKLQRLSNHQQSFITAPELRNSISISLIHRLTPPFQAVAEGPKAAAGSGPGPGRKDPEPGPELEPRDVRAGLVARGLGEFANLFPEHVSLSLSLSICLSLSLSLSLCLSVSLSLSLLLSCSLALSLSLSILPILSFSHSLPLSL